MRLPPLLLLVACQPPGAGNGVVCQDVAPESGTVLIRELTCGDEVPNGGDGRTDADLLLANALFHAVIRSPEEALTLLRTGGGTLLDAAPWEANDPLVEIVPIVGGGWLDVDTFEFDVSGIHVAGTVVDLPDRPAEGAGSRREITWRIEPDDPWLYVDGADGLWVHPLPDAGVYDGGVVQSPTTLQGTDSPGLIEDLGGALRIEGANRWLVAPANGWAELGAVQTVGGTVTGTLEPDGGSVRLVAGGAVIGRLYLDPEAADAYGAIPFVGEVPVAVDALVGELPGRIDSAAVVPGADVTLQTREPSYIRLIPVWDGLDPRELPVSLTGPDGTRRFLVLPDGRDLVVSEGAWDLEYGAVPALVPATARVEIAEGETLELPLRPTAAWDAGERVLAAVGALGEGAWGWRASDGTALATAAASGLGFVVVAPPNGVGRVSDGDDVLRLGWRNGTLSTHPDGWSILSWPWAENAKFGGYGAPDIAAMDPATALSVATGPSSRRFTAVDLAWLAVAPAPYDVRFPPTFVRLTDPGAVGPAAWADWWTWLDAGRSVVPLGAANWVDVNDAGEFGATEVENGLVTGRVSAGTGPLVLLTWGATADGGPAVSNRVEIRGRGTVDRLAVVGAGGAILHEWTIASDLAFNIPLATDAGDWVTAVAWTSGGGDWAVSGPVWLDPPG